jgi:hypothetical protein
VLAGFAVHVLCVVASKGAAQRPDKPAAPGEPVGFNDYARRVVAILDLLTHSERMQVAGHSQVAAASSPAARPAPRLRAAPRG